VAQFPASGAALAESRRQRAAIALLIRSQERLLRHVKAAGERADARVRRLGRRVARAERRAIRLAERSRLREVQAREARRESSRLRDRVQALETAALLDQWAAIVNILQSTAFGDSGSLNTTSNLLLLGNQFAWSSVDPVMRHIGLHSGPSPSLFKWLAPIGSLATGHLLLANRQHVRFVSGTTAVTPGTTVTEPLRSRIADDLWRTFQRRNDVPASVVSLDPGAPRMSGLVRNGTLEITVDPPPPPPAGAMVIGGPVPPPPLRVAWMIDTGAGRG
jgi:hypothetical protein